MNIVSGALIYDVKKKKINLSNPKRPSWSQSLDAHCESSRGGGSIKKGQISLLHSPPDVCDKAKCQPK